MGWLLEMGKGFMERDAEHLRQVSHAQVRRRLTIAESKVVALIARGKDTGEIARILGSRPGTVRGQLQRAAAKLIDGPGLDDLVALRPILRVYEWARRAQGKR
jgi:DNA-binding CsgD family transcriptional regulator